MGKGRLSQTPDGTWHSSNILSQSRATMTEQKDNDIGNEEEKKKKKSKSTVTNAFAHALVQYLPCISVWTVIFVCISSGHCLSVATVKRWSLIWGWGAQQVFTPLLNSMWDSVAHLAKRHRLCSAACADRVTDMRMSLIINEVLYTGVPALTLRPS